MKFGDYRIITYPNHPDGWVAEIPDIPGCYALMTTPESALAELALVFHMIAAEYNERGLPLPPATA